MNPLRTALKWCITRAYKFAGIPLRDPALVAMFGQGDQTQAGVEVTEATALNYSAFWAAVRILSESKAQLPMVLDELQANGDRKPAVDHPAYGILCEAPNPDMTPFIFYEALQAHALTWGNGYAEIVRTSDGEPLAMWPITPDRVKVHVDQKQGTYYEVAPPEGGTEKAKRIRAKDMFHLPGLGFDGYQGYSVVNMARESIALGQATEKQGAALFGNGATPSGQLCHPGELSKQARDNLRESVEGVHRGPSRANRLMILEEGMEWKATGLPPEDSQFLQTRQFQVVEMARWFNLPPHLLRDLTHATFANIEHQSLEFLVYSLSPWLSRWEQEARRKLIKRPDWRRLYLCHDTDHFLTMDVKTRYEAYRVGRYGGWMSANDIRTKEGMPHSPERAANELIMPTNMTIISDKLYGDHQGANDISKSGLTGAQVSSLLEIASATAIGTIPASSAAAMIHLAFPMMSEEEIAEVVNVPKIEEPADAPDPTPMTNPNL